MSDPLTRRRFLHDALFTGGALLAAVLLTVGVEGRPSPTPTPAPTASPHHPLPGKVMPAHPQPSCTPPPVPPPGNVCPAPPK